jgi:hypothetical protein
MKNRKDTIGERVVNKIIAVYAVLVGWMDKTAICHSLISN